MKPWRVPVHGVSPLIWGYIGFMAPIMAYVALGGPVSRFYLPIVLWLGCAGLWSVGVTVAWYNVTHGFTVWGRFRRARLD